MTSVILALNAGSSSLKFSLFAIKSEMETLSLVYRGEIEGIGSQPRFLAYDTTGQRLVDERLPAQTVATFNQEEALSVLLDWIEHHEAGLMLSAVGHRVVHGGTLFSAPVLVDPAVINQLEQFVPLAPLHQNPDYPKEVERFLQEVMARTK